QTVAAEERNRNLEDADQELHNRIDVKEALIYNLIAGRTTLVTVRNQFLILDQDRLDHMYMLRKSHPGATDEEAMTQNVISYTLMRLDKLSLAEKFVVIARLDAELRHTTANRSDSADNEGQSFLENQR